MLKFKTSTAHTFEVNVPGYDLTADQARSLISAIEEGVSHEEPALRRDLITSVVSEVNRELRSLAVSAVMLSEDVIKTLCEGVGYGKLSMVREGDSVILNYGYAMKRVQVGRVDKTPLYEERLDFVQYSEVVRAVNAYSKQLKKEGYKEGYTLKGGVSPQQFNLLTVMTHNFAGTLTEADVKRLSAMGDTFACFAEVSNTKRLEAVQFWYDLFNARTGHDLKALGFIVKELKNDRRLATFDSHHYTSTVPGEYTLLSVLISHYVNSMRKKNVLTLSKAKKTSDIQPEDAK